MKKFSILFLSFTLILTLQLSCFTAERSTKKQKVVHQEHEQAASSCLQEIKDLSEKILDFQKRDVSMFSPGWHSYQNLIERRRNLVCKLNDNNYQEYLCYRFPGKIIVGDVLSHEELLQDFLPTQMCKIVCEYAPYNEPQKLDT